MAASPRLVLFDIDGTLLSAGRASREALMDGFRVAFGAEVAFDGYDFSGKTDPQIVRELLGDRASGDHLVEIVPRVVNAYLDSLERRISAEHVVLKKGIAPLLDRLAGEPDVALGILTGNVERGARAKLAPPGLNGYFPFGAFGNDDADRYRLPPIALERARNVTGRDFRGKEIVIIGDSIHDVGCGRSLGVRTLAVASGPTGRRRLEDERPDYLFDDLSDTEAVFEAIAA